MLPVHLTWCRCMSSSVHKKNCMSGKGNSSSLLNISEYSSSSSSSTSFSFSSFSFSSSTLIICLCGHGKSSLMLVRQLLGEHKVSGTERALKAVIHKSPHGKHQVQHHLTKVMKTLHWEMMKFRRKKIDSTLPSKNAAGFL